MNDQDNILCISTKEEETNISVDSILVEQENNETLQWLSPLTHSLITDIYLKFPRVVTLK